MGMYPKGDCRDNGGHIKGLPMTHDFVIETKKGPNRHEKRMMKSNYRNHPNGRHNTRGVPLGFNKQTWDAHCKSVKEEV